MVWWITFMHSRPCSGFGNYSVSIYFNYLSEQGVGGVAGHIGLTALQPVPCSSRSYVAERVMGALYTTFSLYVFSVCEVFGFTCLKNNKY